MYQINWKVTFKTDGQIYDLRTVVAIDIDCTVDNLTDTAVITLPEAVMNRVLNLENKIKRGSEVTIQLGYDKDLKTEFVGYVTDVTTNDSSLKIVCEDALFLFRKGVKDQELKPTSIPQIAQQLIDQIDPSFKLMCDYTISYEKFVIHQATAFDVLKKIAEETKCNIFFNTLKKELHIHPPYSEKGGDVVYSMQNNVEKSSLEYKQAIDKKIEVTVESTDKTGKVTSIKKGTTGGDTKTIKVGNVSKESMNKIADAALLQVSYDGYDGSIDTWLVPFVQPTYTAKIKDEDYPEKTGKYYVVSVKTSISENGAKRTVQFSIKLGNG